MLEPTPPVLIFEGLDLAFCGSVAGAQLWLEAIDVRDGVYTGYDSEGRLLRLDTKGEEVLICAAESEPHHVDDLKQSMSAFLRAVGDSAGSEADLSLRQLLEACARGSGGR